MITRVLVPAAWNKHEDSYIFRCARTKREYQRIVGGMMWPGSKPGYCVVLGQARFKNPQTKLPDIWTVAEHEEDDVTELLRTCALWTKEYCCEKWYGHPADYGMMRILHRFNEKRPHKPLSIIPALGEEEERELEFYVNLIRIATSTNCKVLQFNESKLPQKMFEMDPDSIKKKCEEYPAVSALGFALCAMEMFKDGRTMVAEAYVPLDPIFNY